MTKPLCIGKKIVLMPRAYQSFLKQLIEAGHETTSRGLNTIEILNGGLLVRDPIDRIIPDRGRKINIAFAIAEWYAVMFGVDSVQFFERFISDYGKYSTDKQHIDGAYGTRIQYTNDYGFGRNQIDGVVAELQRDPTSRRAVLAIYSSEDLFGRGGLNTPCTLNLQFLIRENQLHLIVNMRSSDVVKGVTYDLFLFTMIQEYVARKLDVELGQYHHNAGSLHFYTSDTVMYNRLTGTRWPSLMHKMPFLSKIDLDRFHELIEYHFNEKTFVPVLNTWPDEPASNYLRNLALVMECFTTRKSKPNHSQMIFGAISDNTLKYVLRPWLK